MSIPNSPGTEIAASLKLLLLALGRQGREHLIEVDADLQQTSYLLVEAITKLSTSFMGLHAAAKAQQTLISAIEDSAVVPQSVRDELIRLQDDADRCVGSAVTALQFQDMTDQLIGRIVGHTASLQQVLQDTGAAGELLHAEAGNDEVLTVLCSVNKMLENTTTNLDHVSRKPVAQTHMESGDIELF